jgi:hypothetical protein
MAGIVDVIYQIQHPVESNTHQPDGKQNRRQTNAPHDFCAEAHGRSCSALLSAVQGGFMRGKIDFSC